MNRGGAVSAWNACLGTIIGCAMRTPPAPSAPDAETAVPRLASDDDASGDERAPDRLHACSSRSNRADPPGGCSRELPAEGPAWLGAELRRRQDEPRERVLRKLIG